MPLDAVKGGVINSITNESNNRVGVRETQQLLPNPSLRSLERGCTHNYPSHFPIKRAEGTAPIGRSLRCIFTRGRNEFRYKDFGDRRDFREKIIEIPIKWSWLLFILPSGTISSWTNRLQKADNTA